MPKGKTKTVGRLSKRWRMVVGLTGGLGSGKSTVLAWFRQLGAFTLDADRMVHHLLDQDPRVLSSIRRSFGPTVFLRNGSLNKKALASLVFSSQAKRRKLERLLHPRVRQTLRHALQTNKGAVAVCDIPLLFEKGWQKKFDKVIVVTAPLGIRIKRLLKRGLTPQEAASRMRAQWPLSQKVKQSDFVIRNHGPRLQTKKQVRAVWKKLQSLT